MAVTKDSIINKLVDTSVEDFERKIDEALQKHASFTDKASTTITVNIVGTIDQKRVMDALIERYRKAGWQNMSFKVEAGYSDCRDSYTSPTTTKITLS